MASLDESTLRKLRIKLDEIQIDLNDFFKENYPDLADQNIEFVIGEGNFIERKPESEALAFLLKTLRDLLIEDGIDVSLIRKKHVSAAESLLKKQKCIELAKDVLVQSMQLSGKTFEYKVDLDGEVVAIPQKEISKITLNSFGEVTLIKSTSSNIEYKNHQGEDQMVKPDDLKNRVLVIEKIDRDEIAEFAAKAFGEFGKPLDNGDDLLTNNCRYDSHNKCYSGENCTKEPKC